MNCIKEDNVKAILQEREKEYGSFSSNSTIAQGLKSVVRLGGNWPGSPTYCQEAMDMICSKISRLVTGNCTHLDSWEDIQGYAKLVADRIKEDEERIKNS